MRSVVSLLKHVCPYFSSPKCQIFYSRWVKCQARLHEVFNIESTINELIHFIILLFFHILWNIPSLFVVDYFLTMVMVNPCIFKGQLSCWCLSSLFLIQLQYVWLNAHLREISSKEKLTTLPTRNYKYLRKGYWLLADVNWGSKSQFQKQERSVAGRLARHCRGGLVPKGLLLSQTRSEASVISACR